MHMEHNNSNSNVANPVIRDAEAHEPLSHEIACSAYPRSVSREESCRRRKDVGASESMKDKQPSMDDNGDKDQEKSGTSGLDPDLSGLDKFWIQSTGFPLVSATFGPVANLLSICALVESWRVSVFNDNDRVSDPPWALAINGLSLFFGIAANVSLLLTFLHRVHYHISQPFTLIAWLLSATLLLALIIVYALCPSLKASNLKNVIWSQSWYYAIMSTIFYFLISFMLASNLWGAYVQDHYPPGLRGLTHPQRSVMLQSILYMVYLGGGAALFAHLEGWRFLDGVYWADYTLLTIGIGSDFPPKTVASRIILVPYAWGGIITVGLVVVGVRGLVVEKGRDKLRLRSAQRRITRSVRRRWTSPFSHTAEGERDAENAVHNAMERKCHEDCREEHQHNSGTQQDALMQAVNDSVAEGNDKPEWWLARWAGLLTAFTAYLLLWLGGAAVFYALESQQRWTYGDSLYFTNIALLTIGYGDLYPKSQGGKPFFVVWSLLAVPTVTVLISITQDSIVNGLRRGMKKWKGKSKVENKEVKSEM